MRFHDSVTSISWIPVEAMSGPRRFASHLLEDARITDWSHRNNDERRQVAGLDHEFGAPKQVSGPLNWARSHPPWLLQFRLACRALEVQTAAAARYWLRLPVQQTPVGAQLLPGGEVFAHA